MAFEQTFKNIDNALRTDEGCSSELDYVEQSSWILFLKYLDDLDKENEMAALLGGGVYTPILDEEYRWNTWAMPRTASGEYDIHKALVGDDLIEFVNGKLFPYLKNLGQGETDNTSIKVKIGLIFAELRNKLVSGYCMRDILEQIDGLKFQTSEEKHEMTYLYESRLNKMGNAGRNGGEYYTPRPLIRSIVKVVNPRIGQSVYDGACGSAGFLCEAYNYMHEQVHTTADEEKLQKTTFYGKEKKALPYLIAMMNMILHGVQSPNIIKTNTLGENLADVQTKDQFDVILANPPFGGSERKEVQHNFPIKTSETAYLFLEHFIKYLKAGGSAGIVIKNTFLSNTDNASIELRKKLLEECNLHTILDLPSGVFQAGVKTIVLFFKKGEPTQKVWFYQLNLDRTLGKTAPLNENDLADFVEKQKTKADSENSWSVKVADLDDNCDLSVKNPNKVEVVDERTPHEIAAEIEALLANCEIVERDYGDAMRPSWDIKKLEDLCETFADGDWIEKKDQSSCGIRLIQTGNVGNGIFRGKDDSKRYISQQTFERLNCTEIFPGDILVSRLPEPIGRGCLIPETGEKMITAVDCTIIRLKPSCKAKYLVYYTQSGEYQYSVGKVSTGTTRQRISRKNLGEIDIPLPSLPEQQRIVDILDQEFAKIDTLKANVQKALSLCDDLKQALLRKAFNGEL